MELHIVGWNFNLPSQATTHKRAQWKVLKIYEGKEKTPRHFYNYSPWLAKSLREKPKHLTTDFLLLLKSLENDEKKKTIPNDTYASQDRTLPAPKKIETKMPVSRDHSQRPGPGCNSHDAFTFSNHIFS